DPRLAGGRARRVDRGGRGVDRVHAGPGDLERDARPDHPRAAAQVDDDGVPARLAHATRLADGVLRDRLGLGAGDEDAVGDGYVEVAERGASRDALERLACPAAFDERGEARREARVRIGVEARDEPLAAEREGREGASGVSWRADARLTEQLSGTVHELAQGRCGASRHEVPAAASRAVSSASIAERMTGSRSPSSTESRL